MDCFALLGRKHSVVLRRALPDKKFQRVPNPANRVRCARSLWPNRRSLQKQPRCGERTQGLKLITAEIHTYKYLNNINMPIIVEREDVIEYKGYANQDLIKTCHWIQSLLTFFVGFSPAYSSLVSCFTSSSFTSFFSFTSVSFVSPSGRILFTKLPYLCKEEFWKISLM